MVSFPVLNPRGQDPGTWASLPPRQKGPCIQVFPLPILTPERREPRPFLPQDVRPHLTLSPGWLVIVWLQDICWRSCCQRLRADQGMNQCSVPSKSVSHLGSSAPSPPMWVFVHHGGPPGTMVRKDTWGKELERYFHVFSFHRSQKSSHNMHKPHHQQVLLPHDLNLDPFPLCSRKPLALLPPRQSFVPCKILLLHGSLTGTSCFPKTIWYPPSWHTALQESWIAIKQLTNGIANLFQLGAHKESIGL